MDLSLSLSLSASVSLRSAGVQIAHRGSSRPRREGEGEGEGEGEKGQEIKHTFHSQAKGGHGAAAIAAVYDIALQNQNHRPTTLRVSFAAPPALLRLQASSLGRCHDG